MPCLLGSALLLLLQCLLSPGRVVHFQPDSLLFPNTRQENLAQSYPGYSVVHPKRVDPDGQFMSFSLKHHFGTGREKRSLDPYERYVYYSVDFKGRNLTFNLTVNNQLLSSEYMLEKRFGHSNTTQIEQVSREISCHLIGSVSDSSFQGTAAISTCKGLKGFFSLPEAQYFIEPVLEIKDEGKHGVQPHVIYQGVKATKAPRIRRSPDAEAERPPCGLRDDPEYALRAEREREESERAEPKEAGPRKRSVSRERWVETMVVADSKLIEYHGSENVESYIFTIMNMVAGIFHDASIGNPIHIILVRLILLQEEEKGLKIVHHADTTLGSFCAWQKTVNPQSDNHPAHHDVAVLITRKDICAGMNKPCETLGLSHLSGMCQPHRSCNINEDSGLPVAFTVAHELGHSFGIHHDGQGNDCEPDGRHPFIMSRQLQYDTSPLTWSPCSRESITHFLDRGWGFCLDDRPSKKDLTTRVVAPGVRYTIHHQCQLQYGPNATFCPEVENICQILWCSVNGSCRSKLDAPADGTQCGRNKWCVTGECVIMGKRPETVNGGWGMWSSWSYCSRTCGAGVQSAHRECNQPKPQFGGKYCMGERKRYRICNTKACPKERPSFREMQCSEFDTVPYRNHLYRWIPVTSTTNPCELHCRPADQHFTEKMLDAVADGTPCFMHNISRSLCINGVCKEVGCDYGIDSNAVEDRCGVCLGDGSSCQTIRKHFEEGEGFGYVDVALIPEGARDIVVQEVEEAGNFLALRGEDPEEYFLNGRFIIQWNGEYVAGGTTFYYERSGNLENLTSPGPTREPVMIQLLVQEKNPGIKYEYTIKKRRKSGNEVLQPEYRWKNGAWTDCSATCGTGFQKQPVRCFEVDAGVVEESFCNPKSRPEDRHRKCKKMDCPARWWVGGWQSCSATCGPTGVKKRTVLCVRTVGSEERVLPPSDCRQLPKPKPAVPCSRDVPCGSEWEVGPWTECPVTCGGAVRSRNVTCLMAPRRLCDMSTKPRSRSLCGLLSCPSVTKKRPSVFSSGNTQRRVPLKIPAHNYTRTTETITTTAMPMTTNRGVTVPTWTMGTGDEDEEDGSTRDFLFTNVGTGPRHDYITEDSFAADRRDLGNSVPSTTTDLLGVSFIATSPSLWTTTSSTPFNQRKAGGKLRTTRLSSGDNGENPEYQPRYTSFTGLPTANRPATSTSHYEPGVNTLSSVHLGFFWEVGNWSECSTTCGLGAVWRTVTCSSANESDCANIRRPEPARRCHLRPCATWQSSNWSKCPDDCLGGVKQREVQCINIQSKRQLRPYHCQALTYRPPSSQPCATLPCLTWQLSPWGKCSRSCGGGLRERLVFCPEAERCNQTQRPNSTETCNLQPCTQWETEEWAECSVSCGEGVQRRTVTCVNAETSHTEESNLCDRTTRPESLLRCNLQECKKKTASRCSKNSVSPRFCEKLKLLGRCSVASVQKQCCVTCT